MAGVPGERFEFIDGNGIYNIGRTMIFAPQIERKRTAEI